ncbi:hypothetical protein CEXT_31581 [Caerostris extrusa]|uniref:Uncharacterized protein n=1 Tax=Caerostris extrusa TaxID=172846 RepID=A0AAV4UEP4_CAEEX|nr:hypothetical protein CEXT_31581 [Caerostris extrusa]
MKNKSEHPRRKKVIQKQVTSSIVVDEQGINIKGSEISATGICLKEQQPVDKCKHTELKNADIENVVICHSDF